MIHMEERHLKIIKEILNKYPYEFYAFGSQTTGDARKISDLDLCYKQEIPGNIIVKLEEDFEESNLPFKVDLIAWKRCSPDFKKRIEKDFIKMSHL